MQERMETHSDSDSEMVRPRRPRFDNIDKHLRYLSDGVLERKGISKFPRIDFYEFGVKRPEIVHVTTRHIYIIPDRFAEPYRSRIEAAADNGLITYEEEIELRRADFVARGYSRQDDTSVWFVAEVSVTITLGDIRRARERADILSRALALSELVIPLAYGIRVSDHLRVVAEERGVKTAMWPPDEEDYISPL